MNLADASRVLAKIQAFRPRDVDELTVRAWAEALGALPVDEALAAVTAHFASPAAADWLMPGHLLRLADEHRRTVLRDAPPPDYPSHWGDLPDVGEQQRLEAQYRAAYHRALFAGQNPTAALASADQALNVERLPVSAHPVHALVAGKRVPS